MSLVVLLGGARSGKSALAVSLAGDQATLIATARAVDAEMAERIRRHRDERPPAWSTVEEPLDLRRALAGVEPGRTVVVDCLSLWTANLLEAGWKDAELEQEAKAAAAEAAARPGTTIVVSNEVGLGIVPVTPLGRRYRDVHGRVNATWANVADRAVLVVAGRMLELDRA